jgi:antibiotic biosynthesis monooxygenase (ABM) superfamily enzyme
MVRHLHQPSQPATTSAISTWQRIVVTWIVLFPLITIVQWLIGPTLTGLPLPVRVAVTCSIVVPTMTLLAMPVAMRTAEALLVSRPSTALPPAGRAGSPSVGRPSHTKPTTKEQP